MRPPVSWIEISKTAFFHNISQYKQIIGSGKLAAVIKSNAYGHDASLIAKLCQENNSVDWLCVASLSDAIALRKQGITKPILVLSYIDDDLALAAIYEIDIICYEKELLEQANAIAKSLGKKIYTHIKIDTGVSRFGIFPDETASFITYAYSHPYVVVRGIFTHFAQAHLEDQSFTLQQQKIFQDLLTSLASQKVTIPFRHCANSAATLVLPPGNCNFFRVGAGIYGLWPSTSIATITQDKYPNFSLKNVLSWKATIISVRTIPANCTIGYDRTFTTTRITKIALLPVGYYEGYDRRLSNTGSVLIHDKLSRVIGRVCMNVLIVDVTDIPATRPGDCVLLLADHDGIRPHDLAQKTSSFNPREILAHIHPQIPRMVID